jgi:glucose-6-phosphate 1-dehydrogenase
LAKKKTFPALFDLFRHKYIPPSVNIVGYARSDMSHEEFSSKIKAYLRGTEEELQAFLARCSYHSGGYDSTEDFLRLHASLTTMERNNQCGCEGSNRLYYFAVPPNVFIPAAAAISANAQSQHGWTRVVVEKPFGHDLTSALEMSQRLQALWREDQIYRIDHYLGKEMVQNLTIFRFGNTFLEPLLNNRHVSVVKITFKEDFGTMVLSELLSSSLSSPSSSLSPPPLSSYVSLSVCVMAGKRRLLRQLWHHPRHHAEPPHAGAHSGGHGGSGASRWRRISKLHS